MRRILALFLITVLCLSLALFSPEGKIGAIFVACDMRGSPSERTGRNLSWESVIFIWILLREICACWTME